MNKPLTLLLSAVVGAAAFAASAAALDDLVAEAGVDKSAEATAAEPNGEAGVLQAAVPSDATVTNAERPAKITSDMTVYNRKEGIASFEGHVHVDDEQYQMHADRVFLFFETEKESGATNGLSQAANGTNGVHKAAKKDPNDMRRAAGDVRRVVAIGNVAMTNDAHRAYGAKATYSKKNGLVVLYSGDGITAEVRDESKAQPQIVRGKRIRFWIDSEQVEVDEADLTGAAPSGGAASLKKALGK